MIKLTCPALLLLAVLETSAAVAPIYVNTAPLTSPPDIEPVINARAWLNEASFQIFRLNVSPPPFESFNTLHFTNAPANLFGGTLAGGVMVADPGFRFSRYTNGLRYMMDNWVNEGVIITDHSSFFNLSGLSVFFSDSKASKLMVSATNIVSPGSLFSGAHGLIYLEGKKIDLSGGALRTGQNFTGVVGGGFAGVGATNYVNDVGIIDLRWGLGTNNTINNRGGPMRVDGSGAFPQFDLPNPSSPLHQVVSFAGGTPFQAAVPGFISFGTNFVDSTSFSNYTAAVLTNVLSPTSSVVQVVFYPTNFADTNFSVDVRFSGGFQEPAVVVLGFHSLDFDLVNQTVTPNSVYLVDAVATQTNTVLARIQGGATRRPNNYEVLRTAPFEYFSGTVGNTEFSADLIYSSRSQFRSVTNFYTSYAAYIDLLSSSPSGENLYDPTNMPGRIDILGGEVNLDRTRIRAESAVTIKATNLVGNQIAQVDAPYVNFDARSRQPELVISNLAPATVRRLTGTISAWSGTWRNFESIPLPGGVFQTNEVNFHVLIVDPRFQTEQPVVVNEFAARATNVVVTDQLTIGKSFAVEGRSFHLTGELQLPSGSGLGASNLINVLNFTNDGIINLTGSQRFGTDRTNAYWNYINRGTNIGSSHFIRSTNFVNSGLLLASGGNLQVDALSATIVGNPLIQSNFLDTNIFTGLPFTNSISIQAPATIQGVTTVELKARNLSVSNSVVTAGKLILNVTNSLRDSGPAATNLWSVTSGFESVRRPTTSSMMGVHLRSSAASFAQVTHKWAGTNAGAFPGGFSNNMALGKLTLDGGTSSRFSFSGVGANNAIYVDYLELLNGAADFNASIVGDPNFRIYFANANFRASVLDGAAGGRLRWVRDFTGPLSSTNLTYPSGSNYTFNIALVTDRDLDSDGDGIVNADDPTPILVSESVVLSVGLASAPLRAAALSWNALGYSSNLIEFKASTAATDWLALTNFVQGQFTLPVTVLDPLSTNGASRVYRLRVDPGPYYR